MKRKEVNRRVTIAKRTMGDLYRIGRYTELPIQLKRKLDLADNELRFRGMGLPKGSADTINVSKTWFYRIMLRISWTEHVTNAEVFSPSSLVDYFKGDWLSMVT